MRTPRLFFAVQVAIACLVCMTGAFAQRNPTCTSFTVVTQDKLNNVKEGLSADDAKWFREKIEKKYPGACYVDPGPTVPVVFYIKVTPDTYHGTRVLTHSSTESNPVNGTITDEDGNVSRVSGTVDTTTTSSIPVPYSFEYGIFTLSVESRRSDGTLQAVQTFQQKGIYNTIYGIPLGGRGHHPAHAVIEDAAKWVSGGGLTQRQYISQPSSQGDAPSINAFADLQTKALAGDAKAQFNIGVSYAYGKSVSQDYSQAAAWYRKAAEQGLADAQNALGYLYFAGRGVPQDYVQAAIWTRKAADQGDPGAEFNLGYAYDQGQGVPQDFAQAAAWWRKAADQGDADAEFNLGSAYDQGQGVPQDFAQAAAWWRKAAEQGIAKAQGSLGLMYAFGQGLLRDDAQAAYWTRKAAEQGNVDAQFGLGYLYFAGRGVPQDYVQAAIWYRKAADQGDATAQSNLGRMYSNGQGLLRDDAQAAYWTRKAAEQGNAEAQLSLSGLYNEGQGVPQDRAMATVWLRKAAEQGLADAQFLLGLQCGSSQGVLQDYADCYFWLDVAASGKLASVKLEDVTKQRDLAASHLTPADLTQAQARASKWFTEHSISR